MKRTSQLRRLCALRGLEEQHRALLLARAKQRLQEIDQALTQSGEQRQDGKALIRDSVRRMNVEDRAAGLEEIDAATRKTSALMVSKNRVEDLVRQSRDNFLSKRLERRQAEAVLELLLDEEARNAERRSQSELDEWHRAANRRPAPVASADE